ncbi:hypothetical protein [Streptomyces roseochromogenus]|uniref:Uncharacterized protein n=1 Tax=Streptomyces roseochromogenus subsp. oscitans DS 12.976 TaxID=1352936 RepID=V6JFG4_STRRC|nr:hypothetical protein [Streptomyces roseochromogenus]EST17911.1 hypothetical protein M878_46155 [Streptomyces roseochromogenus subsp. oscitans DS 12.976]
MTGTASLDSAQQLIAALRHGEALDDAAEALGVGLTSVWAAARSDVRLTIALAGRDPDAAAERARIARAEYLRLLALGVPRARAELILGEGDPSSWRTDPAYARACDAVVEAAVPYGYARQLRLTPQRVARFLHTLRREGRKGSVKAAAAAVGISPSAVYQRRHRDPEFARAMDRARAEAGHRTPHGGENRPP